MSDHETNETMTRHQRARLPTPQRAALFVADVVRHLSLAGVHATLNNRERNMTMRSFVGNEMAATCAQTIMVERKLREAKAIV